MRQYVNLTGKRFGRLEVIATAPRRDGSPHRFWECKCDCGNTSVVSTGNLNHVNGVRSCGCMTVERLTKHGGSTSPEYKILSGMKKRCFNRASDDYANYGGRGITVCDKWLGSQGFQNFIADMGKRPSSKHSIERKNNDGNYEPGNCVWADAIEQGNNRRDCRYFDYSGRRLTASQLARICGINASTLHGRLTKLGHSVERAMSQPVQSRRPMYE